MKAESDPQWGATGPLAVGVAAILCFGIFVLVWAEQRLISSDLPVQGVLLLQVSDAPEAMPHPHVRARLDPWVARRVTTGQEAILYLHSSPQTPPLELSAEVVEITRNPGETTLLLRPRAGDLPRIEGLPLVQGSPVAVSLRTEAQSVLRLLLDPAIGVISGSSTGGVANDT